MTVSAAASALNRSAHTLGDVTALAQQSPAEAEKYLRSVAAKLTAAGQTTQAQAIEALLGQAGALGDKIAANPAALGNVFPADASGWSQLAQMQTQNAQSIGFQVTDNASKPVNIQGTVTWDAATTQFKITTPGGKELLLAESNRNSSGYQMGRYFMGGMIEDGPINIQGTLGIDGKTFNVEGFALNRDGAYDKFTFARVVVDPTTSLVTLDTPRGVVAVTNPEMQAKLKAMPRLGIILPGEPTTGADGKQVYDQNPPKFFGLARFREMQVHQADASVCPLPYALTDMAYSIFNNKPCTIPPGSEGRVNHGSRFWAEGNVQLGADGVATRFESSYISQATDTRYSQVGAQPDASPIQTAVMSAEAGV